MGNHESTIAVIGTGAVGCTVAAALADAGHKPNLCLRTGFSTLIRRYAGTQSSYELPLITTPADLPPCRTYLLCTKTYQTEAALSWIPDRLPENTTLAVLQNGVDQIERLSSFVDADQIVPVVVLMACERLAPGEVMQPRRGRFSVPDTARGRAFAQLFDDDGAIDVQAESDFVSKQWHKLGLNAVNGAICALTLQPNQVLAEPQIDALARALMAEVVAVGKAEGATYPDAFIDDTMSVLTGVAASHWTSMAADRRDGQPMEWQARNAVVGRLGRQHGIKTPLNDTMTMLLSASASVGVV